MMLADVRDYIDSLGLSDHVYSGKMRDKVEQSIGVYNSKHKQPPKRAIGGRHLESYGLKPITILVHWNRSQRETEEVSQKLYEMLCDAREVNLPNNQKIKWWQPLYEPQDVGTDNAGIYEMVIEAVVVYEKGVSVV